VSARKSERLLNLLITLLVARSYVTKERIREVVEQYRNTTDDAFEKMFERDKEELRSLGIPIEVGYLERGFEDDPGYRVERSAFELPEIDLAPDEAAVIGLAARVWQHAGLASATSDALVKLKAAGVSVDREALNVVEPQLAVEEPAFEPFWDATRTRTPVRFAYRSGASAHSTERHLEPWGVVSFHGRWYVVGHDGDREDTRVFRLSRVVGTVQTDGTAAAYVVPEGTDLRALTESLTGPVPDRVARVRVRSGAAVGLRHHATPAPSEGLPEGWERLEVPYARTDAMAEELLGYGSAVVVEGPQELRDRVVERLRRVAGAA
jgi:proteasome accessory factor B